MNSRADDFLARHVATPMIMGVVNVTPDSFSDAGQFHHGGRIDHAAAAEQAWQMARQGAAIVDIGGEASSFHRPGIGPIDPAEQLRRILPVIQEIVRRGRLGESSASPQPLISVDTRSHKVAEAALLAGADIINDISAGTDDPEMLPLAVRLRCPIILMHRREEGPDKPPPIYADVCTDVFTYLQRRSATALQAGVARHRILLDPGLGFGKTAVDSWKLLAGIEGLAALGFPVVLGASRKRFLGDLPVPSQRVSGPEPWPARDILTSHVTVLAAAKGVMIHRVHNVALARAALDVFGRMNLRKSTT